MCKRAYKNQTYIYVFVIVFKIMICSILRLERLLLAFSHTAYEEMRMI